MKMNWHTTLLYLALAGMQGTWIALALLVFNKKWAADSIPWAGIFLFYPLAFTLNRLFRRFKPGQKYSLVLSAVAGIVVFALFRTFQILFDPLLQAHSWPAIISRSVNPYHPEFLILIAAGILWALGSRLARVKVSFSALFSEFQFGLVILFVGLFAEQKLEMNLPHLVPLILSFFSFALLGAGIAHGREHAGWISSRYLSSWISFLLIAIALVLGAGLLLAVLVSPSFIYFLFSILYQAVAFLLSVLGKILHFLIGLLPLPEPTPPLPAPPPQPSPRPEDWYPFFLFSDSTREVMRVLWTIMVASLLVVALWRISSQLLDWLRRRMGNLAGEEVEPLPGAFRADLKVLLTWLLDIFSLKWFFRLLRKRKKDPKKIHSLRQIYAQLLKWSAVRGGRREISQTPYEFLPKLCENLPEAREHFVFITHQYVKTRYSGIGISEEVLVKARRSWQDIQKAGNRYQRRQRKK